MMASAGKACVVEWSGFQNGVDYLATSAWFSIQYVILAASRGLDCGEDSVRPPLRSPSPSPLPSPWPAVL